MLLLRFNFPKCDLNSLKVICLFTSETTCNIRVTYQSE